MSPEVRDWAPDVAVGVVVLVLGVVEVFDRPYEVDHLPLLTVALATAGLVALCRHRPGPALAGTWLLGLLQVASGSEVLLVEIALLAVLFSCARWGRPLTLFLSGLSIVVAAAGGVLLVVIGRDVYYTGLGTSSTLYDAYDRFGGRGVLGAGVFGVTALCVPWLAGLALRSADAARVSRASQVVAEDVAEQAQRESEQAHEIAQLRADQARLARDVHDVVGHSLAVILAQAESGQYLPDDDPARIKATLATIATSARSSLQDVRHVLTAAQADGAAGQPRALDTLVEGVRASGHDVRSSEVGSPQPLPPELEVVAYRVLQEMLTNAIKHGRREEPVEVERHWPDGSWAGELRIEVRNVVADDSVATDGQGLEGMRRRLEAAGGRLDVRRREEGGRTTFTTTAWVPVRTVTP